MLKRTLCFENAGFIHVRESQLVFEQRGGREIRVAPVEDVGYVILENVQVCVTAYALQALTEAGAVVLVCDSRHLPASVLLPLAGHTRAQSVTDAQLTASASLKEKLWKQTVVAKIRNQAECLRRNGKTEFAELTDLGNFVHGNDADNREGIAAAKYFKAWGIVRTNSGDSDNYFPNPALNYGYTVLRAAMARALAGSGLLCLRGIHHHNQYDALPLADDIMEPYRPFVDDLVLSGEPPFKDIPDDSTTVSHDMKKALLRLLAADVIINGMRRPLANALSYTSASLASCFEGKETKISYPEFAK